MEAKVDSDSRRCGDGCAENDRIGALNAKPPVRRARVTRGLRSVSRPARAIILLVALSTTGCHGSSSAPRPPRSATPSDILPALAGTWTGILEYADVRTNDRVQLPTSLTASFTEGALRLAYTYSDPSGMVMNVNTVHRTLGDGRRHVIGTDTLTTFSIEGFAGAPDGREPTGTAVLTGTTTENGVDVPSRHQIVLRGDSLIIRKETGDPPRFRNEYRFRRDRRSP